MRILFFISAAVEGKGGHYHSLDMISREIGRHADVSIIAIGPGWSKVIQNNPHFKELIYVDGFPGMSAIRNIKRNLDEIRPDVIHCFDDHSYNYISFIIALAGIRHYPLMLNRCGGPNSPTYTVARHMVMFMQENAEFYKKNPRFKQSTVYLIPNRVSPILDKKTSPIFEKKGNEFFIFRIGRINRKYQKTVMESIELARRLTEHGITGFRLFVIGTNDDAEVYREIMNRAAGLPVEVVTNEEVTVKASAFLHYADAAICTGRGFMEACSLGIPVLAGAVNVPVPVPVNPENFQDFFHYNFSERAVLTHGLEADNLKETIEIINNPAVSQKYGDYARDFFNEYFDMAKAVDKYFSIYNSIQNKKVPYFLKDNWMNFLRTCRFFRQSRGKVKKLQENKKHLEKSH